MRISPSFVFPAPTDPIDQKWGRRLLNAVWEFFQLAQTAINGRLTFGDGVDIDNIKGKWASFESHAVANTEFAVTHDLGQIPVGYIDVGTKDKAGVLYKGTTAWTTTTIYLKCSIASTTCLIFILLGPEAQ
jgi:hypothetical protein